MVCSEMLYARSGENKVERSRIRTSGGTDRERRAGNWSTRKVQELMFSRPYTADRMVPCAVMIPSLLCVYVHPERTDGKVNETVCKYVVILVAPFP